MKDLKLCAKNDVDLESLLSTVANFGLDKSTKVTFQKGPLVKSKNITLDINT